MSLWVCNIYYPWPHYFSNIKNIKKILTFSPTNRCFLSPSIDRSGAYSFWLVGVSICLFVCKNFWIGHSFWMVSDRAFIFCIYIPWDKTLSLVPKSRSSVKVKVKYQGYKVKKMAVAWAFMFHKHILFVSAIQVCWKYLEKRRNCLLQAIFFLFHSVFYHFGELSTIFIKLNPLPHNDTFWRPWETSLLKTLWEKEKLLVTSNFSFSHSVFYPFG